MSIYRLHSHALNHVKEPEFDTELVPHIRINKISYIMSNEYVQLLNW